MIKGEILSVLVVSRNDRDAEGGNNEAYIHRDKDLRIDGLIADTRAQLILNSSFRIAVLRIRLVNPVMKKRS